MACAGLIPEHTKEAAMEAQTTGSNSQIFPTAAALSLAISSASCVQSVAPTVPSDPSFAPTAFRDRLAAATSARPRRSLEWRSSWIEISLTLLGLAEKVISFIFLLAQWQKHMHEISVTQGEARAM
jgi:hypothetical protein